MISLLRRQPQQDQRPPNEFFRAVSKMVLFARMLGEPLPVIKAGPQTLLELASAIQDELGPAAQGMYQAPHKGFFLWGAKFEPFDPVEEWDDREAA